MISATVFIFILGLAIGSFLNVLIDRLPQGVTINGRSHCDFCNKTLNWYDLVPVISFFLSGGRCRYCNKKLSWQYPLVESFTGIFFVAIYLLRMDPLMTISLLGIASSLTVIFVADLKYHIIPDEATTAILFFSMPRVISQGDVFNNFLGSLSLMMSIYFLYLVTKGKGMGFGDVKLAAAMGWLLGIKVGLLALYLSFILGGVISLILIALRIRHVGSKIAFGPFLVFGTVSVLFFYSFVARIVNQALGAYGLF